MWSFVMLLCSVPWSAGLLSRGQRQSGHSGHGWDIRLAVPGEPGTDYPTLGAIPRTSFSCAGKEPGYYADLETNCQVFRICTIGSTYGFQSFLCPNGTLFNQAVFVCDWWMNVNCQQSQELFNNNNERFGNLKLGPQLMKDIKKMLTHSMRNPYDKSAMRSNLIVMQDYRPPFGQMFPNGALLAGPDRPNSIYVPSKQQSFNQNIYGNAFAASTPSPTFVPPEFDTISTHGDAEVFQRQRQNGAYTQNGRLQTQQNGNIVPNGHAARFTQPQSTYNNGNSGPRSTQNYNQGQYTQRQINFGNTQFNAQSNGQFNRQTAKYTDNRNPSQLNNGKQSEFGISYSKQQYNYNGNQGYTNNSPHSNENIEQINEAKQNLVSSDVPATIVTKTVTFNRIVQDPKPGSPKSRITFKTWLVKPSKSARLIVEPTPYTYDRPTQPPAAKLIQAPAPYVYNPPTAAPQSEKIIQPVDGYAYNKPAPQSVKIIQPVDGYAYNKPTMSAKQISIVRQPQRAYLTPAAPSPTLSGRLYLAPTSAPPTRASRVYVAPTTYKPAANFYIPPSQANVISSRQYLAPNAIQQPAQFEQIRASPTSPSPVFVSPTNENNNNPSYSLVKQSRINTNHNNQTFSDILTKEKLDITVNDIVSDTSKILKTAAPQLEQFRQDKTVEYSDDYLPDYNESDEKLTPQSPTVATKARLIAPISRELEPPVETEHTNNNQNTNRLANLPFFKEPATNTIERTVSLKISIPEKLASYLFKTQNNESDFDKLEILNTGSSNYLVLTNNLLTQNTGASFIPIGRLISDQTSNISNSQALVFSLLADSLNAAKEYNNIAKQNVISSTPAQVQQYQNINNQDISQITNQVSQLTAAQYSVNNQNSNFNNANVVSTEQSTTNSDQYRASKYTANLQNQPQQIQRAQINSVTQTSQGYPARLQNGVNANLQTGNQIYSGQLYQLPVPDVTSQIYNAGANEAQTNQQTIPNHRPNQNNVNNNLGKQSSEIETVQSEVSRPAKLQLAPNEEFSSQEHSAQALNFLNNGNGISAQINDKIVGTIPHPSENKLVTYKKDQSYFVYTNLNNGNGNNVNRQSTNIRQQNAKLIQNPNVVSFQFIPSVSYQLDDEKEQQKILDAFQLDEYGNPKKANQIQHRQDIATDVDYSVEHTTSAKQVNAQFNDVNTLYAGPSSYNAPQASVGSLESREGNVQNNNVKARLEQFDDTNNGYARVSPARQFSF